MISKVKLDKRRKKIILQAMAAFLFLLLVYKWQLAASRDYLDKGNNEYESGNYTEALKNYKYAAAIDGTRDIIYTAKVKRGQIFYELGQFDEAEKELKAALAEKKDDYLVYKVLADVYFKRRNLANALTYYKQALNFSNGNEEEYLSVRTAKSFIARGDLESAREALSGLSGKSEDALYYLGLLEFNGNISNNDYFQELRKNKSGKYKKFLDEIDAFSGSYDENEDANYNGALLADLYNKIGEPDLALVRIRTVLENKEDYRDAWMISGKANFIIGDYKKSLGSFSAALALDSDNSEAYYWLSSVYKKLGATSKANEYFDRYKMLSN